MVLFAWPSCDLGCPGSGANTATLLVLFSRPPAQLFVVEIDEGGAQLARLVQQLEPLVRPLVVDVGLTGHRLHLLVGLLEQLPDVVQPRHVFGHRLRRFVVRRQLAVAEVALQQLRARLDLVAQVVVHAVLADALPHLAEESVDHRDVPDLLGRNGGAAPEPHGVFPPGGVDPNAGKDETQQEIDDQIDDGFRHCGGSFLRKTLPAVSFNKDDIRFLRKRQEQEPAACPCPVKASFQEPKKIGASKPGHSDWSE